MHPIINCATEFCFVEAIDAAKKVDAQRSSGKTRSSTTAEPLMLVRACCDGSTACAARPDNGPHTRSRSHSHSHSRARAHTHTRARALASLKRALATGLAMHLFVCFAPSPQLLLRYVHNYARHAGLWCWVGIAYTHQGHVVQHSLICSNKSVSHMLSCCAPHQGLPISIKDLFYQAGYDTTCGCEAFLCRPAEEDGPYIKMVKAHGAIPFIRSNGMSVGQCTEHISQRRQHQCAIQCDPPPPPPRHTHITEDWPCSFEPHTSQKKSSPETLSMPLCEGGLSSTWVCALWAGECYVNIAVHASRKCCMCWACILHVHVHVHLPCSRCSDLYLSPTVGVLQSHKR